MEEKEKKLTDADGQFEGRPGAVGLAVAVGAAEKLETVLTGVGDATAEGETVALDVAVLHLTRRAARTRCAFQNIQGIDNNNKKKALVTRFRFPQKAKHCPSSQSQSILNFFPRKDELELAWGNVCSSTVADVGSESFFLVKVEKMESIVARNVVQRLSRRFFEEVQVNHRPFCFLVGTWNEMKLR